MTVEPTKNRVRSSAKERPLLFISHRHSDRLIADAVRKFVNDRSGGRIQVFQSSSADAESAEVGRELHKELKEHLWRAGVVVLIYTSPDEDWSYCMWECGVATHPQSPDTKIIVLQCGSRPPSVYRDAVRIKAQEAVDIQKFVNSFLTNPDFFPNHGEAVAPGFAKNGDEVQQATREFFAALNDVIVTDADEGEDWPTVPFLRLQLTYAEVDAIRKLGAAAGAHSVEEAARVSDIDSEAKRIFGIGRLEPLTPISQLIDAWRQERPDEPTKWFEELCEQVRVGSHWRLPRFGWQLVQSADDTDRARYAPVLSRVRSVPRQRCHQFDIYFSKFDTDADGAVKIGFANEPQATPD
jgi:hypothetical protein